MKPKPNKKLLAKLKSAANEVRKRHSLQRVVKVRQTIMLRAYAKVVNSIAHLNDEERRRVIKAANITCGGAHRNRQDANDAHAAQ